MERKGVIATFTSRELGSLVFSSIGECCDYFKESYALKIQTEQIRRRIESGELKSFEFNGKTYEVFFDEM